MIPCVIANAASIEPSLARQLEETVGRRIPAGFFYTSHSRTEFRKLAAAALAKGATRIVVAGGDGSMAAAANAFAGTDVEVALLPFGGENDFARTFGLPDSLDAALDVALGPAVLSIDLVLIHCRDHGFRAVKTYFVNAAEAGFGGEIVRLVQKTRRWTGRRLANRVGLSMALRRLKPASVRLSVDGQDLGTSPTTNLIVGNARFLGNGALSVPNAKVNDGVFDVIRLGKVDKSELVRHGRGLEGASGRNPNVQRWRAHRIEATCDRPVPIQADGELVGWLPASFEIVPQALKFVVPARLLA